MVDKVLYFPYIRVPGNEWFTRVLLYWDEVGSIVPSEYIYRPESLGTYMRELVQAQLVRQVLPGDYIPKIPKFKEAQRGKSNAMCKRDTLRTMHTIFYYTFVIHSGRRPSLLLFPCLGMGKTVSCSK
jgi:hypothetical protein